MSHVVTCPLVVTNKPDGSHVYLYEGAVVPSYVKGAQLKALVDEGMVGASDEPEPDEEPEKAPAGKSSTKSN